MTKWNEITLEFFEEIFKNYWNHTANTENKVLEIQFLRSLKNNTGDRIRIFFGAGIKCEDYPSWNKGVLEISQRFKKITDELKEPNITDCKISMCITEEGPRITPLGAIDEHYDTIWNSCFGAGEKDIPVSAAMLLWWEKADRKKYVIPIAREPNPKTAMVRIRVHTLKEWKDWIESYIGNSYVFPEGILSDDVNKRKIKIEKIERED